MPAPRERGRHTECAYYLGVFAVGDDAGEGDGVAAVGVGCEGGGAVERELIDGGCEFVFAVEDVVVGDDLACMGGHATHGGDEAGLGAALDFVVGLILADGADQVFPFEVVGIRLGLRIKPEKVFFGG